MTQIVVALLLLSFAALLTPRGGQARAEIRAAARAAGWRAVLQTVRHLTIQALHLLVQALRVIHAVITFTAQVLALLAAQMEGAARGEAA